MLRREAEGGLASFQEVTSRRYEPFLVWDEGVSEYLSTAFGKERLAAITNALCHPSKRSCLRVNTLTTTTQNVITRLEQECKIRGAGSETEGHSAFQCWEHNQVPGVLMVGGSGPHCVNYTDGEGRPLKEVLVSRKCGEAVLRGAEAFVPGVLACETGVNAGDEVAVSMFVESETTPPTRGTTLGSTHDSDPPPRDRWFIGRGRAVLSRAAIFRQEQGVAVEMIERVYRHPSLHEVTTKWVEEVFLQHLPSVVAAHVLGPQPGERILDMCASPGGKTTAIAILMKDCGEIIALDRSQIKVQQIEALASQMKLTCIKAFKMDATSCIREGPESDTTVSTSAPSTAKSEPGASKSIQLERPASSQSDKSGPINEVSPSSRKSQSGRVALCRKLSTEAALAITQKTKAEVEGASLEGIRDLNTEVDGRCCKGSGVESDQNEDRELGPDCRLDSRSPNGEIVQVASRSSEGEALSESSQLASMKKDCQSVLDDLPLPRGTKEPGKIVNGSECKNGSLLASKLERRAKRKEERRLQSNQKTAKAEKLEPGSFDRVLLDAPCSALGLRPRLFVGGVTLQSLRQDGVYKRRFLDQAVRLLKPGGFIVYSTCTMNPGENEALVRYALDTYPCLRLVPQSPWLGGPGLVGGADVFDGTGYREWLREGEQDLVQRFDPDGELDTIGFFIAKFEKVLREPA